MSKKKGVGEVSLISRFINVLSTPQRKQESLPAERIYQSVLAASRQPDLYIEFEIPDNLDSRFDMLCLHISLVMLRLRQLPEEIQKPLNQDLFDRFFADMDFTLREMGVGDLGVGKRVRKMSEAFMGRLTAYDEALAESDADALCLAVARNLRRVETSCAADKRMAAYMIDKHQQLARLSDASLQDGKVDFVAVLALNGQADA